jgi:hypothetical protein
MAEIFVEFTDVLIDDLGVKYHAQACGAPAPNGEWHGWLEFLPLDGSPAMRTGSETTQPNRTDLEYWATGLTAVYLEGALQRALKPLVIRHTTAHSSVFEEPAPTKRSVAMPSADRDAVLDPFAVYEKGGKPLLSRQLTALAAWHLVNIVHAFALSADPGAELSGLTTPELVELIVSSVEEEIGGRPKRRRLAGGKPLGGNSSTASRSKP